MEGPCTVVRLGNGGNSPAPVFFTGLGGGPNLGADSLTAAFVTCPVFDAATGASIDTVVTYDTRSPSTERDIDVVVDLSLPALRGG